MLSNDAKRRLIVALTSKKVGTEVINAIDNGASGTDPYTSRNDFPTTGEVGIIYIDETNAELYLWDGSDYVLQAGGSGTGNVSTIGFTSGVIPVASDTRELSDSNISVTGDEFSTTISVAGVESTTIAAAGELYLRSEGEDTRIYIETADQADDDTGDVRVYTGDSQTGQSGYVRLYTGETQQSQSGYIRLRTGYSDQSETGEIRLATGGSNAGQHGPITLSVGDGAQELTLTRDGEILVNGNAGVSGQILTSSGPNGAVEWQDNAGGSPTGNPNSLTAFDVNGDMTSLTNTTVNQFGGIDIDKSFSPDNNFGFTVSETNRLNITPVENNSSTSIGHQVQVNLDTNSSGYDINIGGTAAIAFAPSIYHQGSSDVGGIRLIDSYSQIGDDGQADITVDQLSMSSFNIEVRDNVTIEQQIAGYNISYNIRPGASINPNAYFNGFTDYSDIAPEMGSYTSFRSSPQLQSLGPGRSMQGVAVFPNIDNIGINSNIQGVAIGGNIGTFGVNGNYVGVEVNANIDSVKSAQGIRVNMNNVNVEPGAKADVTIQDLNYQAVNVGADANNITIEYVGGGTAGSEVISLNGTEVTIQIEDGVSTAQQIKTAVEGTISVAANVVVIIIGSGSNPQVIEGPTPLSGGVDAGQKFAADLIGDVRIDGNLQFSGALSIGKLDAFASIEVANGTGVPVPVHSLISAFTLPANESRTLGDSMGLNTACLMQIGDNSSITTALTGLSALTLPAVVSMGSGATVDRVAGATFAINLDAGAGGGAIAEVDLCRALAIPNGITSVDRLFGYKMDMPFGDIADESFGIYVTPAYHNYFAGDLLIGGTPVSDDVVTNGSVALEVKSTTKAILLSRMTTAQRDSLSAVAGMMIYNTDDNKFQGYANGTWSDLN